MYVCKGGGVEWWKMVVGFYNFKEYLEKCSNFLCFCVAFLSRFYKIMNDQIFSTTTSRENKSKVSIYI